MYVGFMPLINILIPLEREGNQLEILLSPSKVLGKFWVSFFYKWKLISREFFKFRNYIITKKQQKERPYY